MRIIKLLISLISCSTWLIISSLHNNTSFIHSCWKTLPARRPLYTLEKTTNHNDLLTTKSSSWIKRVWNLYVDRKKKRSMLNSSICRTIFICVWCRCLVVLYHICLIFVCTFI
jgi:hypothetical protein